MDNLLIIETASSCPFLLFKQKQEEKLIFLQNGGNLSKNIHTKLNSFLYNNHIKFVAVGIGPGSFTGIRVGVTIAQTLAYSFNIPLIPFCSPLAFSPQDSSESVVIFDARSQGLYLLENSQKKPIKLSLENALPLLQKKEKLFTPDPTVINKLYPYDLPLDLTKPFTIPLVKSLEKIAPKRHDKKVPLLYT